MLDKLSRMLNVTLLVCGLILLVSCIGHPDFERSTTGLLMLLLAKD